jgi:hypothetical protein
MKGDSVSDLQNEITAVKIRHLGQCPLERGHDGYGFVGFMAGLLVSYIAVVLFYFLVAPDYRAEAIQRGYAYYDAKTSKFTWR